MGAEMATNLHNRLGLSAQAAQYSGIKLYTNNGEVVAGFDATGKLTEGKGKINKNTQKNIIFHLDTLGTADIVSAEVNIGQKNGEKYIDSFGEIDWEALKDAGIEELTVKVTVE